MNTDVDSKTVIKIPDNLNRKEMSYLKLNINAFLLEKNLMHVLSFEKSLYLPNIY